jgi:hypothetical protein
MPKTECTLAYPSADYPFTIFSLIYRVFDSQNYALFKYLHIVLEPG